MKSARRHLNTLRVVELIKEVARGVTLPPGLLKWLRQRRQERLARYHARNTSYPYCGKRHRARLARQVAGGQKRAANGVVSPAF